MSNVRRLLAYFFKDCKKQFHFLKHDHGFSSLAGMVEYDDRYRAIISPHYDLGVIEYPFHATVRYEREDLFFEILYGDYNYALECYITYQRRYRFLLTDLVQVLSPVSGRAPITFDRHENEHHCAPQVHHIRPLLQTIRDILEAYAEELLISPSDAFIEKALDFHARRTEERVRERYARAKDLACEKAARAFQEQDFKRTIMLYRPYKDDLGPRDIRMLSLAISYLDQ